MMCKIEQPGLADLVEPLLKMGEALRKAAVESQEAPICPRCNTEPRARHPDGTLAGYCVICRREVNRELYKSKKGRR